MWPFKKKKSPLILTGEKVRDRVEQARVEVEAKMSSLDAIIHFGEAVWNADLEEGTISFITPSEMTATAPVQVIGTYNQNDNTFLWGWDHPSIDDPIAKHAKILKEYGQENKLSPLTERTIKCSEEDCWEFTILASHLNKAQGIYKGISGETLIFMTFGEVNLSKTVE